MKTKYHNSQVGTILFLDMKVVRGQFFKEQDKAEVNHAADPLIPKIHIQILQTDVHTFLLRIAPKNRRFSSLITAGRRFAKEERSKEEWLFSHPILRTVEGIWFKIKAFSLW